jgi:hypothetical protein
LKDEFNNTYRLDGPYKLECGEMQEFQYIVDSQVCVMLVIVVVGLVFLEIGKALQVLQNIRLILDVALVKNGLNLHINVLLLLFIYKGVNGY